MMYGELRYNDEVCQYNFPILAEIPSTYPKLLPFIKLNLPHVPHCSVLNNDGSFNLKQLLDDKTLTLVNIFDLIIVQLKLIPLQSIPFYFLPSSSNTISSSQHKPHIIQPNLVNTKTESSLVYPRDIQLPKQNEVKNEPITIKPILPINTKPIFPINRQIKGNPTKPAQRIIIGKECVPGFNSIESYLDYIDYEKELIKYEELLENHQITKEAYNIFKSGIYPKDPLPPPERYKDILELYKNGNITRDEINLNVLPLSKEERAYIKNMDELDEMQKTFAEMFLDGEIEEEEMIFLNNSYKEYLHVNPE
ncbi:hypothetical protein EHI_136480 [Entamoeba histolytica HM-1:IMSS]|uniref:UEV domain-containing protein n=6 Tax=Entamoeba histolytica TaxID=5759 RepID=C4M2B7_ENTH1|nr:hypothetical protein EHI_136480 [Entamoeba histolytica HM-1:IMSS]EAL49840.2 hypothetical protein EHI_136480 [Entamoeba histolytica HM-1:IMSS]EMD46129.1 Hypothetical protein EHI5A_216260 [Entamoeba histolytica KU27]ENY62897.1 hypothetical protein EHI7A_201720 [Entamoeba histolytica HM-1:IMSS-A]|eukprot:XP_655226.2 hypothetical protein EHI_136480 [Entamoeba histolytica HM-1:IMSS]